MIRKHQQLLALIFALLDSLLLVGAYVLSSWLWLDLWKHDEVNMAPDLLPAAVLYALLVAVVQAVLGCYDMARTRSLRRQVPVCWTANLLGVLCGMAVMYLLRLSEFSRGVLVIFYLTGCVLLTARFAVTRALLGRMRLDGYDHCHVLVIGTGTNAEDYARDLGKHPELGMKILGYIGEERQGLAPCLGGWGQLPECLERLPVDEAVIALSPEESPRTGAVIEACEHAGVRASVIPSYSRLVPHGVTIESIGSTRMLSLRSNPLDNLGYAFLKRAFDIGVSAVLLVLLSPLILVCVIGVRLSGKGPVLFRQERVGLNRKTFTMLKLRTMRMGDDADTGWTTGNDPRRTRFGSVLRKLSIDELPQLVNVLRGDMSLVGPRPEVPYYVEKYSQTVPRYMVKHQVRPGMTGWAQVNGWRGDTSIEQRIRFDIWYIEHWSPLLDLRILLRTLLGGFVNSEKIRGREE